MLHYTKYEHPESKQWVTFVHGAGGSSSVWFKQIKAFKAHFNVLLIDLRGHGRSQKHVNYRELQRYTFNSVTKDVVEVLDHLKIEATHMVGISLGTIIIRELAENWPDRVKSMVMGGAILKMNFRSQILMKLGFWLKSLVPYLLLYKLFAFVIMPRRKHVEARSLFVREARKLYQREFIRWFKLTADLNPLLKWFRSKEISIPTLYVMGDEDYMFLPSVQMVANQHESAQLVVLQNSGHVCNVDQPGLFNDHSIDFIYKNH
ncbi:alpha/beta hydrolase [Prolixibacteraceae bacterium JC049]|nr:alpha/beta hydrolase [Prolixibacteraceae bacterium JC049]